MHSLISAARSVATSVGVIAPATRRHVPSPRRLRELPNIGEHNSTRAGRRRAPRNRASGRWRTSIVRHPVTDVSSAGVSPNVFGGDHAATAFLRRHHPGAIDTGAKSGANHAINPSKQVRLLRGQQASAFFLIEKDDRARRKSFSPGRRYRRVCVGLPQCYGVRLQLAIQPSVEKNKKPKALGLQFAFSSQPTNSSSCPADCSASNLHRQTSCAVL